MNTSELIRFIGSDVMTPFGQTRADQVARSLRSVGLLPVGGRGLSAAQIQPTHAAFMLIGMNAHAAAGAEIYLQPWTRIRPSKRLPKPFDKCDNFLSVLVVLLANPELDTVAYVTMNIDWPAARIRFADGNEVDFGDPENARREGFKTSPVSRQCTINGSFLSQLALEISAGLETAYAGNSNA